MVKKMKETKDTTKVAKALEILKSVGGTATGNQILAKLDEISPDRTELKTINSVNATLAYIAKQGRANKTKVLVDEKERTQYTLIQPAE